jgi:hypothetical protein
MVNIRRTLGAVQSSVVGVISDWQQPNFQASLLAARYFLPFDPVLNSYGKLAAAWTPAGDFKVEINFSCTSGSGGYVFFDYSPNGLLFWVRDGILQAYVGNGSSWVISEFNGVSTVTDGKWRKAGLSKVGSLYTIFLDDVIESTVTNAAAVTPYVSEVGRRSTGFNYFPGVLANPKLTDLDTPANSLEFKLNKATGEYELPVGNVTGSELVTNSVDLVNTTGWTSARGYSTLSVAAGNLRVTADSTTTMGGSHGIPTEVGATYEYKYTFIEGTATGADVRIRYGTTSNLNADQDTLLTESGSGTVIFVATSTTMYVGTISTGHTAGQYHELALTSVKKVTSVLLYNNIPEASRFQAGLVGRDWVATNEQFENGDFASSSGWTLGSGATITNGQLVLVSSSADNYRPTADGVVFPEGIPFLVSVSVSSYVSGDFDYQLGLPSDTASHLLDVNANGISKGVRIVTSDSTNRPNISTSGDAFTGNIDYISGKRILEAPPLPIALFTLSGIMTCDGTISCSEIIPCGD